MLGLHCCIGFSPVVASRGYCSLRCLGFSLLWLLLLQSKGSRHTASVVAAHGLSSCVSWTQLLCGMWNLPGPGIKPVSPASGWPADCHPLCHQGSPDASFNCFGRASYEIFGLENVEINLLQKCIFIAPSRNILFFS